MADEQRIRLKPGTTIAAMFDEEAQHLIIIGGAITTTGRFARFDESLCHLSDDGVIRRYGRVIGSAEDIEYLPTDGVAPTVQPSIEDRLKVQSGPFKGKPQQWFTRTEVTALLQGKDGVLGTLNDQPKEQG